MWLFQLLPLIIPSDNTGAAIPDHVPEVLRPSGGVKLSGAADENKLSQRDAAPTTVELLCGVRDAANPFGPLKSVAGGLCLILENCGVWSPLRFNSQFLWQF